MARLPLVLVSLICATISRLALAKDEPQLQGDNFCNPLMCVTAFVNDSVVTYQMSSLNQLGWMAIGFGTLMENSAMVLMWWNGDGSITLSQRTATGDVEPTPDSNPPRVATTYPVLSNLTATLPTLSFTIPKNNDTVQNIVWAYGTENPNSSDPNDANLAIHQQSGATTLNLQGQLDADDLPSASQANFGSPEPPSQPTGLPSPTGSPSDSQVTGSPPFKTFEKLIVAHAVIVTMGFLVILPTGAMVARWGRMVSDKWFYYHWFIQVVISIPIVVIGWTLGPLAVAEQGAKHADDSHKAIGILLFPLYIIQLCLGTFIHFFKKPYPQRHPPQNFVHGGLGIIIVVLAFVQTRTGLTKEWTKATSRGIALNIFSNLWIAWAVFVPVAYFAGFALLSRQLAHERSLPPPYTPPPGGRDDSPGGIGVRRLLGTEPEDDGTHDIYSETRTHSSGSSLSTDIEMREVSLQGMPPSLMQVLSSIGGTSTGSSVPSRSSLTRTDV
ncbi:hypothetical protein SCHPADRAFT_113148 [Schizopora paradoxa]|uniref:Cytochrome b561 domain-containing protein n=1 Tax=Schizopora paradoxa TaxID=27342 RepID=A0A0H2S3I7_9AGAM|nr:hypothetical protein SCHPADRAFT_113148 [Schizopora paradoxa]